MKKLLIEVYGVNDQAFYDEQTNLLSIEELCHLLDKKINSSYLKNKVELKFINVLQDPYDEARAKNVLNQGYLLPWTFFNGELSFYNGFDVTMIYNEALKTMSYKMVKRNHNK